LRSTGKSDISIHDCKIEKQTIHNNINGLRKGTDMAEIKRVGILGAGMMGAEIALCCAQVGLEVQLKEISKELADLGKARIEKILAKSVEKGKMDAATKDSILGRVTATDSYANFGDLDIVVEAIIENLEIKHNTYKEIDAICKPECIFASNTSSLSITKLAKAARPERFIGLHFFSPASIMQLVEVVPGLLSSPDAVEFGMEFCRMIGKEPIKVKNVEGFVVNRILCAMMAEAYRLIDEDIASPEDIDKACRLGLGHPVGPFRLADNVSMDLLLKVHETLTGAYGDRFKVANAFRERVDAGLYGRKTGKGWYDYSK
jgi:3-hydroxybutyryl-CoA dehydrogenase